MLDIFLLIKKTIVQRQTGSIEKCPVTAWKVNALKIIDWNCEGLSGAVD